MAPRTLPKVMKKWRLIMQILRLNFSGVHWVPPHTYRQPYHGLGTLHHTHRAKWPSDMVLQVLQLNLLESTGSIPIHTATPTTATAHPPSHLSGKMALKYHATGSSIESFGVYRVHPMRTATPTMVTTPSTIPVRQNGFENRSCGIFN